MSIIRRVSFFFVVVSTLFALTFVGLTEPPAGAQKPAAAAEDAYRANNLGVALMEQYKYKEAAEAFTRLPEAEQKARPWLACATAHPYKFADVVEPLVGVSVTPTPALAAIDHRSSRPVPMRASLDELARFLGNSIQEHAA